MSQPDTAARQKTAFVGIGRMGSAMLRCVLDAGYPTALFDPSREAIAPFLESHPELVRVAPTAREAAQEAEVTSVVVNTNDQALQACLGPDGVLAGAAQGSVVLVHSTIELAVLRELSEAALDKGVHLMDAPVSGARGHLDAGDLAVMVGGEAGGFAKAEQVMNTYGGLVLHLGPLGAGLDAKLALNMLRYLCMAASQAASALAERAGVAAAMEQLVAHTACTRYRGDFSRLKNYPLENRRGDANTAKKDLRAAAARGAELGVDMISAQQAIALMDRLWAVDGE